MKKFQNRKLVFQHILIVSLAVFISSNAFADLLFAAPPRETAEQGRNLYQPIAEQLTQLLGEKVVYQQPANWFEYGIRMRSGMYDIIFDGPHFAAWRIKHVNHTPVASLPGNLKFNVFTSKSETSIQSLNDLEGKVICGILSPNLGTTLVMSHFSNSSEPPIIYAVTGDIFDVYKNFKEGLCVAAILRDAAYNKLTKADQPNLKVIFRTKPLPNQTITVGPKLLNQSGKITEYLTSKAAARTASKLLKRYSKKAQYFVSASEDRYLGVEKALVGVVSGW